MGGRVGFEPRIEVIVKMQKKRSGSGWGRVGGRRVRVDVKQELN